MDEKDLKLDFSGIDDLLAKLANSPSQTQLDLDYDYPSTGQAATITQAASATWPYTSTGTGNYGLTNNGTYTFPNTTGGYTLTNSNGTGWDTWNTNIKPGALQVKGDAEFEGDVKIKGKSIAETLDKIEQRLAILHPNEKLEEKWEELKKLGEAYRALEKDIIEKEKIWETLKK